MNTIKIIGDVHGKRQKYLNIVKKCEFTCQIGDMDFNYNHIKPLDSSHHVFFGGNHDNYSEIPLLEKTGHCLGDFGERILNDIPFFFIRGGYSIDRGQRILGVDYWAQEELSIEQQQQCVKRYGEIKPDIVLSHECPGEIAQKLFPGRGILRSFGLGDDWRSSTQLHLQYLFSIHQPKLWIFGHHHSQRYAKLYDTKFFCIPELGIFDLDSQILL